ncbi:MAG TPA: MarR family transcriptional regulator [Kineosporiaceae bacterium]
MTETPSGGVPDDELTVAAVRLASIVGNLVRVLRRQAPTEVGPGSLAALATLSRCGPMRLGDLAAREGVAPPTLTRMVAAMEEAGLVTRCPDERDRRAVLVSATAPGARVVTDSARARAAVLRSRLVRLPPERQAALWAALPALEALLDD